MATPCGTTDTIPAVDSEGSSEYSPTTHSYVPGTRPKRSLYRKYAAQVQGSSLDSGAELVTLQPNVYQPLTPQQAQRSSDGMKLDSVTSSSSIVARFVDVQLAGSEESSALADDHPDEGQAPTPTIHSHRLSINTPSAMFMDVLSPDYEEGRPSSINFFRTRPSTPYPEKKPVILPEKSSFQSRGVIRTIPGMQRRRMSNALQSSNQLTTTLASKRDVRRRSKKFQMYLPVTPISRR